MRGLLFQDKKYAIKGQNGYTCHEKTWCALINKTDEKNTHIHLRITTFNDQTTKRASVEWCDGSCLRSTEEIDDDITWEVLGKIKKLTINSKKPTEVTNITGEPYKEQQGGGVE